MSLRILVVDDDPVAREIIGEYLAALGHNVCALGSGSECAAHLTTDLPDLVLLDLLMPGMNGLEVLRTIRADPRTAQLPVVMLSADLHMSTNVTRREAVSPNSFLQKPFDFKEVVATIDQLTPLLSPKNRGAA